MAKNILQERLEVLLKQREYPKTICPSEAPRSLSKAELEALGATEWRELMPKVRSILWKMRELGEVEILQKGEPVPLELGPEEVRGPIRARKVVTPSQNLKPSRSSIKLDFNMVVNWEYSEDDFVYTTDWEANTLSKFDKALQECWHMKQNDNVFRYKLNVQKSKFLGEHRLVVQLNTERGSLYRQPQKFVSFDQPFNPDAFNFTKMNEAEKMMELKRKDLTGCEATIAVNVSPIQRGHSLILPSLYACLPQVMTRESLQISLDILLLSASPALRVIYNSPCAFASINHLHFHALYLDQRMSLETAKVQHLSGPCFELIDFPSKGFMFEMSQGKGSSQALCSNVFKLISLFQKNNIAHNLCLTRGTSQDSSVETDSVRDCVRVYVWGRTPCTPTVGSKTIFEILPAACTLFGFITAKTEELYEELSEEDLKKILHDVTITVYESLRNSVKLLFKDGDETECPVGS